MYYLASDYLTWDLLKLIYSVTQAGVSLICDRMVKGISNLMPSDADATCIQADAKTVNLLKVIISTTHLTMIILHTQICRTFSIFG